ncbi:hypothetical protein WMY93_013418 [Mugilogobius chulae]|uniref:Uncharacterized protein n=1 Tax=Mugilogobius chulae TaxID=88201 RepID=A0AAW0PA12_9GOBI
MSKDWADFTQEDDELLYSEEFNLAEFLGETFCTPSHLHQTSEASKPEEAQSREELFSKEQKELRLLGERERQEFITHSKPPLKKTPSSKRTVPNYMKQFKTKKTSSAM